MKVSLEKTEKPNKGPKNKVLGKVLYGILFMVFLPTGLICWSMALKGGIDAPVFGSPETGLWLTAIGAVTFLGGVSALWRFGKGLPMNAYPPERYVTEGIYRFISQPIYSGFFMMIVGLSIFADSSAGLWIISPIAALGCVALVMGYERDDLSFRFGEKLASPLISLPAQSDKKASVWDRTSVYLLVLAPWFLLYEIFVFLGPPSDSFAIVFDFERGLPVIEWTEAIYASAYLFVAISPLIAKTSRHLRDFAVAGLLATAIISFVYFVLPIISPPRLFVPTTMFGDLLKWEQALDSSAAAFPSFHVVWAFIAASLWADRFPSLRALWYMGATAIAISCVTTGMHAVVDIVAGIGTYLTIRKRARFWWWLLRISEKISNSWREWRLGPVRIINHGFYAGLGALVGLTLVQWLVPSTDWKVLIVFVVFGLIGGDLLAQIVEGSSGLLRPFGYYGGLGGGVLGLVIAAAIWDFSFWELMGAFSCAAPFIQGIGRLRCLVQGCCHGRLTDSDHTGIRYTSSTSRVATISHLAGKPLLPTPLYSILFNLFLGFFLLRLWFLSSPLTLIVGLYFILAGLGRFVEETYRGEAQTPVFGKLHIYHWLAISSVVLGAVISGLPSSSASPIVTAISWSAAWPVLVCSLLVTIAMGVDFPNSSRRFTRLTT